MVEISFDQYHDYQKTIDILHAFAEEYPGLTELYSIGQSTESRELWLIEIANKETGPSAEKPGVYVDGNTHSAEVTGREVCLWLVRHTLESYGKDEEITNILDTRVLYVLPCMNPDGAEIYLTTPYNRTGGGIPNPEFEWREGLSEEDVNGDGWITKMRVEDPNGDWRTSEADPRIMVKRAPNEFGGTYYRLFTEGLIRGYDGGEIKMAPPRFTGGTNRNWPERWKPESRAYGTDVPLDEPEARAQADFWRTHKNICGGLAYHTHGGLIVRSSSAVPDSKLDIRDIATYEFIGDIATELTGDGEYPSVSGNSSLFTLDPAKPRVGTAKDFFFDIMGVYAWTYELWDLAGKAGIGNFAKRGGIRFTRYENRKEDENLRLLQWNDEALDGEGFVDWRPFDHPQLGRIEIGDWKDKFTWRNPPHKFLEEECERTGTFILMYAALTPRIELTKVESEEIALGIYRVSATVKNQGFLPTNITEQAKKAKIAKKATMEIQLEEGAELIMGKKKQELGHLEGRSDKIPGRFYTPLGPKRDPPGRFYGGMFLTGGGDRSLQAAEWLVKTAEKSAITIVASSEKGGVARKKLVIG